jgi:small subunit ribosomal protein S15
MPDKTATISDNRLHDSDTGSAEVQIVASERIRHLTEYMKVTRRTFTANGLLMLAGRRRRMLTTSA